MPNLVYYQDSGKLFLDSELIGTGYSGAPGYQNKPELEFMRNSGCIPHGTWSISDPVDTDKGVCSFRLTPIDVCTHGRDGFMIHGDSIKSPGTASHGCIIMPRVTRFKIRESGIRTLEVKDHEAT